MRGASPRPDLPHLALFLIAYAFILAILLMPKGYFLAPRAEARTPPAAATVFLADAPAGATMIAFDR